MKDRPATNPKLIIIGASSGIGRELAVAYAQRGWQVGITGRREALLQELADQFPGQVFVQAFDVTEPRATMHLERLIDTMGGIDLLIYNSGYGEPDDQVVPEIDRQTVGINVSGFTTIVSYTFNYFLRQGRGHIAATSSIAALRGNSFAPAYSASKAYMSTYMEGLYMKTRRNRWPVHLTDIQPGFVNTRMAKGNKRFWVASPAKAARQIIGGINRKRFRVYITRRWWLVAKLMQWLPRFIYYRIG